MFFIIPFYLSDRHCKLRSRQILRNHIRNAAAFQTLVEQNKAIFLTIEGLDGSGVELEVYPSAEVDKSDYTCEIWIA